MITKHNAKDKLFELRCKYGKTQEQVSEGSSVSRVTIHKIENGKLDLDSIRAETFFKLNKFFEKLGN